MEPVIARKVWRTLEPLHGIIYFAPEAASGYASVGIGDARAGYFASRSAPMGAVAADVVVATFFNFNPDIVRRALPACWDTVSPADLVRVRLEVAGRVLERILGDAITGAEMAEAAALAREAVSAPEMSPSGRALYAGHASLGWPDAPHQALWHAISVTREYRGDGHIAALVSEGLDGIEALVIHAATGEVPRAALQSTRAWSDAAWEDAVTRLAGRGLVDPSGALTDAGRAHRARVEDLTDRLALAPWAHLGEDRCARLRELCRPWSRAVVGSGGFA